LSVVDAAHRPIQRAIELPIDEQPYLTVVGTDNSNMMPEAIGDDRITNQQSVITSHTYAYDQPLVTDSNAVITVIAGPKHITVDDNVAGVPTGRARRSGIAERSLHPKLKREGIANVHRVRCDKSARRVYLTEWNFYTVAVIGVAPIEAQR